MKLDCHVMRTPRDVRIGRFADWPVSLYPVWGPGHRHVWGVYARVGDRALVLMALPSRRKP